MLTLFPQRWNPEKRRTVFYRAMFMFGVPLLFAQDTRTLIVPDGTPVELRFAQAIRRKTTVHAPSHPNTPPIDDVRKGDAVRLIVAVNLRVEGQVVIVRDAVARAIVTGETSPFYTGRASEETGLSLQFETVTGVLNTEIPLRAFKKGSQEPFYARIRGYGRGAVIYPAKIPRFVAGLPQIGDNRAFGESSWIPMGTRITAFVHGPVSLDRKAVEEAQAQLPAGGSAALITVYRVEDKNSGHLSVSCDGESIAAIGEKQFAIQELAPGAHICSVEAGKPITVAVAGGEEYYLRIHQSGKNWELKRVETSEGQAAIATAQMVTK